MIARISKRAPQRGQRGYALLMVIFLVATLATLAAAASLNVKNQGQREKETELAWRGNQYVRAIRFFYKKNGRFPKTLDELTAYHTDQPNFIRKAYKDPMNKADGSWRFIYVLPNGQLQGSVMHTQLQGAMPIVGPLGGTPAGGNPTTGAGGTMGQPPTFGSGTQQPLSPATPATPGQASQSTTDSTVFGGSIIGVASKVKLPSMRVYKLGTSYYEWEFIWDPTAVTGLGMPGSPMGGAPTGTQPPAPTTPGQPGTPGSGQPQGPGQ
jgi:type II secretory pathway pseudopilin PulG